MAGKGHRRLGVVHKASTTRIPCVTRHSPCGIYPRNTVGLVGYGPNRVRGTPAFLSRRLQEGGRPKTRDRAAGPRKSGTIIASSFTRSASLRGPTPESVTRRFGGMRSKQERGAPHRGEDHGKPTRAPMALKPLTPSSLRPEREGLPLARVGALSVRCRMARRRPLPQVPSCDESTHYYETS